MKKAIKKAISVLLIAVMVFGAAPLAGFVGLELPELNFFSTKAEATSGTCGENLTWTFDESTGVLSIEGSGEMDNYSSSYSPAPWFGISGITAVRLPEKLTSIGSYAFFCCTDLSEIPIPANVTQIGNRAFGSGLTEITVDKNNSSYSNDEYGVLFNKDKTVLVKHPMGNSRTSYSIPGSVVSIGEYAFDFCENLVSITIPSSVKTVGDEAFYGCYNLSDIKASGGFTRVGANAFFDTAYYNDKSNWENNVLYINKCLIKADSGLVSDEFVVKNGTISLADGAFSSCTKLTKVTLPNGVTHIGDSAFYGCSKLTNATLPQTVTYIGDRAFMSCANLVMTDFPSNLTYVGSYAFCFCFNITGTVNLNGVVYDSSFSGTRITGLTLGSNAKIEYDDAEISWMIMGSVEYVTVHEDNPYYSNDEFGALFNKDKTELIFYPVGNEREVYRVPNGTKKIATYSFADIVYSYSADGLTTYMQNHLKSIILPDTVEIIEDGAFCVAPDFIHVPSSVTSIGEKAFLKESDEEGISTEVEKFPYICSDTEDCYAKEYADANGIKFVLCEGHEEHNHSYTSSVTESPSCTSNGVRTYTCVCGDSYTETIPLLGHTVGGWEIVTEPTTTVEGEKVKKCTVCSEVLEKETIPVISKYTITWIVEGEVYDTQEYAEGEDIFIPINPMKLGYDFIGWVDKNGDCNIPTEMPAENLTFVAVWKAGSYTITFDANGGYFYSEDESEPIVLEVDYGESIWNIIPSDPVREGYVFVGYTDQSGNITSVPETMPACDLYFNARWESMECEHSAVTTTVSGTCTTPSMQFDICEFCGEKMSEPIVIPAPGHSAGDWEIIVEATCTAEGKKIKKCTACSETLETEAIDKLKHIPGEWVTETEATIETEGKKVKRCTVCNTILEEEIIPRIEITVVVDDKTGVELGYIKDSYDGNVEISVEETFDGNAINIVNTETSAIKSFVYDIKMILEGEEIQPEGKVIIKIPLPEGYNPSRTFVYYVNTETKTAEKMPAIHKDGYMVFETTHFSYYALVEEYGGTVVIRTPSTTSISYGDSIVLHADVSEALPAGWTIKWDAANGNFDMSASADGTTCTISPSSNGSTTFTLTVYDAEGNAVSSDTQTMNSKAGFFDKIIAFFKKLFGLTKTIPQAFKAIY